MRPRRSPSATWSCGANANAAGVPQRRTSTFAFESAPSGTDACEQVRKVREKRFELRGKRREPRFAAAERVAELADFALQRFDVAAGGLRATDVLRTLVASLAQALDMNLQLLALGLERDVARAVERETAAREIRDHGVEILSKCPLI